MTVQIAVKLDDGLAEQVRAAAATNTGPGSMTERL
jgi:hypothetical protein